MTTLEEMFPPFQLRITCGPVELRVLRDEDFTELVDLVRAGIQHPDLPPPFLSQWHLKPEDVGGPEGFPTESVRWWWTQRATCAPDRWSLALTVRRDGVLVGMQDMGAKDFALTRSVSTGSWLGLAHHGQGTGTLMRQLVVGFAFDELGARECRSEYTDGNAASAAVSRKTGYVEDGTSWIVQDGERGVLERRVVVTPETYVRPADPVQVQGADALRRFLKIER